MTAESVTAGELHDAIGGFVAREANSSFDSCPLAGSSQYFGDYLPLELRGAQDQSAPEVKVGGGPDGESFLKCDTSHFGITLGVLDVARLADELASATVAEYRGGTLYVKCPPDDLCEALWITGDAAVVVSFDNYSSADLGGPWDAESWLKAHLDQLLADALGLAA